MKALQILPSGLVFLAAITVSAAAQPPTQRTDSGCVTGPAGRVECVFTRAIRGADSTYHLIRMRMDSAMMKRAVLGLELRPTGNKRDTLGVFVENVAPGGPADKAGIVEGDRIAAVNGVDLRVSSGDIGDPYTDGLAAHRLRREVEKLAPGARVSLRVYSGGRFREVEVTAGRASDLMHGESYFRYGPMLHFDGPGAGMMQMLPDGMRMMLERGEMPPMPDGMRMLREPGGSPPMPDGMRNQLAPGDSDRRKELRGPDATPRMFRMLPLLRSLRERRPGLVRV